MRYFLCRVVYDGIKNYTKETAHFAANVQHRHTILYLGNADSEMCTFYSTPPVATSLQNSNGGHVSLVHHSTSIAASFILKGIYHE